MGRYLRPVISYINGCIGVNMCPPLRPRLEPNYVEGESPWGANFDF